MTGLKVLNTECWQATRAQEFLWHAFLALLFFHPWNFTDLSRNCYLKRIRPSTGKLRWEILLPTSMQKDLTGLLPWSISNSRLAVEMKKPLCDGRLFTILGFFFFFSLFVWLEKILIGSIYTYELLNFIFNVCDILGKDFQTSEISLTLNGLCSVEPLHYVALLMRMCHPPQTYRAGKTNERN